MLDYAAIPNGVTNQARTAILNDAARVYRAVAANDVEQVIGTAKDLVECVSKVVIQTLGGTYGSDESVSRLARQALAALKVHPDGFQGRPPLQEFAKTLAKLPLAVAELPTSWNTPNVDASGWSRTTPAAPGHRG